MIGSTICGRYRVLEEIGRGNMGVVYKALDEALKIPVAVKVLPVTSQADELARKRFLKTALQLAPVSHPNVVGVQNYCSDHGVDILVMEFVPGVTLDDALEHGPLPEADVVQLGIQLADGLSAAHTQGLMHRDLKPGNLRIMPDGRLKILDFGLAKKLQESSGLTDSEQLTKPHTVPGTLPYMAPEQLLGQEAEQRTDIYAAGAVLYEMATGKRLHPNLPELELQHAILNLRPKRPRAMNRKISRRLERIILKTVQKDPKSRYQTAVALQTDLKKLLEPRVPAAALGALPVLALALLAAVYGPRLWNLVFPSRTAAVAVLPLENLSADPEQEYRADGMTDELITQLGMLLTQHRIDPRQLTVIGPASVMKYKHARGDVRQIGRELGASFVLDGSVSKAGQQLRVRAHLERASDRSQIWQDDYNEDVGDVFAVEDSIVKGIVRTVLPHLLEAAGVGPVRIPTSSTAAHEAYLKGLSALSLRTGAGLDQAVQYFEQAVAADSGFAPAHAGLADAYDLMASYGVRRPRNAMPRAKEEALRALALDNSLAEAHCSLALVLQDYEWDWSGAEKEFQQALKLNRNYAPAHHWYASYLASLGRMREANDELKLAQKLDPLSPIIRTDLGTLDLNQRRYDDAIDQFMKTLKADPGFTAAYGPLGVALWKKGRYPECVAAFEKSIRLSGAGEDVVQSLRRAVAAQGYPGLWRWQLEEFRRTAQDYYVSPFAFAQASALLEEPDQAFGWLEKAYQDRSEGLVSLRVNPIFDGLRSDPRYAQLIRRMGLTR